VIDQIVAQSDLERSDIRGVRRQESGERVAFEPILTEQAREEQAEDQFQERRENAREEADVDAITRLGGYDVDELNFDATDDGTTVEPTDEAARENLRERAADQFDVDESEVEISNTEEGLQASVGQDDSPLDDQADEDVEPGTAANVAGEFGQEFRQNNPLFGLAVGLGAASLRTESGAAVRDPITGEVRTLPGRRDVRASTERLQPASERIDAEIQSGVETAFTPVEIAAERTDTSAADVAQNPSDALLSETVVEGTERGVTSGVQMFNPAAATRDAVRFGDLGTRAADRATQEGSEEDIQRVGEAAAQVGGTAAQAAPGVLVTTAANDPARFVQAPVAGGTVLATGTAGSVALGRGLGASVRAGRRAGRRLVDSDFVSDQRGLAQIPRRQDEPDTISGDEIAGRPEDPDQSSIRPELERGDDVDPNSELARRRDRRVEEGVDDRGRDEAFRRTMERRQRTRDQPEEDLREAVDLEPVESTEDDLVPVSGESSEFISGSQDAQRTDAEATPQEAQLIQEEVGRVEQAETPQVTEAETVSGQEEQLATGSFGETDTSQQQQQEQASQQEIEQEDLLGGFAGSDIEVTSPLADGAEETGQPQRSEGRGREDTDTRGRTGVGNRQRQRTDTRGRQDMRTGLRTQLRLDTQLRTNFRLQRRFNRIFRTDGDRGITPRPDPEFNENGGRVTAGFGRRMQEGAGVGVSRLVEPGWFAETVEAAGSGPTIGPRSELAADPGSLSDVEVSGFDLATEAIEDPDPGVEATAAVFGLDLDDEEEEQQESRDSLSGFSGFAGFGGFNL
jgi:hypothetical protein